jgi:phosphoribosyl 1,2-cyclic phosphodiesterase
MALYFKSLCSSSSGNCLAIRSETTRVLIDCGLGSMRRTREALKQNFVDPAAIDAVIISHMHSDHISYYPLRVFEEMGCPVRVHEASADQLEDKHFKDYGFSSLQVQLFGDASFKIGDLEIEPFEVSHNPCYPTYGFVVRYSKTKLVIATDFNNWQNCLEHFVDADFIFVESNHDVELLRRYYNPNSRFHMSNPRTAELVRTVRTNSKKAPQSVMLGHMSDQRNRADLALEQISNDFEQTGTELDFALCAAPLFEPSNAVMIGG